MKGCIPFTDEQLKNLIRKFSGMFATRNRCLVVLGVFSGFRISEMLSLKIKDVYVKGKVVDQVYVKRASMKGSREGRSIDLHPIAQKHLLEWIEEQGHRGTPDSYVFKGRKGDYAITRSSAWRILKETTLSIGIYGKIGTHCMRKTYADRMLDLLGGDVFKLQKAMGHAKVDSTIQYVEFKDEEVKQAIKSLHFGL